MPTWDKTKPAATQKIRLSDEEIRDNWDCLEDALAREHTFPGSYGGTAGQHAAASLTGRGTVELATEAETIAGTDETRAVTPKGLAAMPDPPLLPLGYFSKLEVKNNAAVPVTKIDISADAVVVADDTGNLLQLKAFAKTVNCATTGLDALDTGILASTTWYYFYAIAKADGTQGSLASLSATSPTMPTDYTYKKLVSVMRTNASVQFLYRNQAGRWVYTSGAGQESIYVSTSASWTLKDISAYVPPNAICILIQPYVTINGVIAHALAWDSGGTRNFLILSMANAGTSWYETIGGVQSPFIYRLNPAVPQTIYVQGYDAINRGGSYLCGYELNI